VDFIKVLTNADLISKTTEEKIDELKKHLQTIKTILENKTDIM
jgi:predicted transcriptional regulator